MTPEELNEGNKLIAEFMDIITWVEYSDKAKDLLRHKNLTHRLCLEPKKSIALIGEYIPLPDFVNHLKYHTSWDWLMPVVEKIEGLKYSTEIYNNHGTYGFIIFEAKDEFNDIEGISIVSKIEAVWLAVVEFIKPIKTVVC